MTPNVYRVVFFRNVGYSVYIVLKSLQITLVDLSETLGRGFLNKLEPC